MQFGCVHARALAMVCAAFTGLLAVAAPARAGEDVFRFMTPIGPPTQQNAAPQQQQQQQNNANTKVDFQTLLKAAERGDPVAQMKVSLSYVLAARNNQQLTPQQKASYFAAGVKWARASADQNHAGGQNLLGMIYETGSGVPQNKIEAVRLYRLSSAQGDPDGQLNLGKAYLTGSGVPQDFAEARELFMKSAAQNNLDAENYMGILYFFGRGVAKDETEAARWFRRAAGHGHGMGQLNLARAYANGTGVATDSMLAYFWFNLAAARLVGPQQTQATQGRDAAAARLGPAELERAQAVARDWKPNAAAAEATEAELRHDLPLARNAGAQGAAGGSKSANPPLRGSGTGFVITKTGHVLTNAHVVNECNGVRVRSPGDTPIAADVVAKDGQNDLAVIKTSKPLSRVAAFREGPGVHQGDSVVVYGFPLGEALAAEGNLATGNVSALAGLANDSRQLQISTPIQPGNSGGPLVDMSGNVVGIVVAKLNALAMMRLTGDVPQNVNFAIKASVARSFLEANGIDYQTSRSGESLQTAEVADRTRKFTVKVECLR